MTEAVAESSRLARVQTPDRSGRLDLALAIVALVLLGIVSVLLFRSDASSAPSGSGGRRIARIASRQRSVERRTADSLAWAGIDVGTSLFEGDSIYVHSGSRATLAFEDGTRIRLEEYPFLVLTPQRAGAPAGSPLTVALESGDLSAEVGSGGSASLRIETGGGQGSARLSAGGAARVASAGGRSEIEVIAGSAEVRAGTRSERIGPNESREVSGGSLRELATPARLEEPAPNAQVVYAGDPPPIEFRWTLRVPAGGTEPPAVRIQIAQDRAFREILRDADVRTSSFIYAMPSAGTYFWRVFAGDAATPARRLTLSALLPPRAVGPIGGEVVLAPPGTSLALLWSPV